MKTNKLTIHFLPDYSQVKIPEGTPVIPADNLPQPNDAEIAYWAEPWPNMSEEAQSHARTYGFGMRAQDVS